jgi:hypothetical protein
MVTWLLLYISFSYHHIVWVIWSKLSIRGPSQMFCFKTVQNHLQYKLQISLHEYSLNSLFLGNCFKCLRISCSTLNPFACSQHLHHAIPHFIEPCFCYIFYIFSGLHFQFQNVAKLLGIEWYLYALAPTRVVVWLV